MTDKTPLNAPSDAARNRFLPAPAQRVNAYESIVAQIEEAIESGQLRAGDRLPGERQLMAQFSVSRPTVREALRVLQAIGLVESRPGDPRGPVITEYSPQVLRRSLTRLAHLESVSRLDLIQFRVILESQAAALAASRQDVPAIATIRLRQSELVRSVDAGGEGFIEGVEAFHAAIHRAAANPLIEVCGSAVGATMADLAKTRLAADADRTQLMTVSAAHSALVCDAIEAGRASDAAAAVAGGLYRYYHGELDPVNRDLLAATVSVLDPSRS